MGQMKTLPAPAGKRRSPLSAAALLLLLLLLSLPFPVAALEAPRTAFRFVGKDFGAPMIDEAAQKEMADLFRKNYFSPWGRSAPVVEPGESLWAWERWKESEPWGENLRPHSREWVRSLHILCDIDKWGSVSRKAVACVDTDLRALPTSRPFFEDPSRAGEGYPFDYLQNSRVKAGEPLFVGHYSADGAWAFVETGYASGWVDSRDIAFMSEELAKKWQGMPLAFVIDDDVALRDSGGIYRFTARVGAVLPVVGGGKGGPLVIAVPVRDEQGQAVQVEALLSPGQASDGPLPLTEWNLAMVIDRMLGKPYGWGDLGGNRDCSGSLRDLFTAFGVWLPRNSAAQAKAYPFVPFGEVPGREKEERLALEGVPFATLLAVPGHIMLYLGTYRGEPWVFHSMWGVRTLRDGKEGRHIVGSAVITTLRPGRDAANLDPRRGDLAERLLGMTFLVPSR